jgi:Protein of unknown function (DUF2897)
MLRGILIVLIVVAVLVGGLLALRTTARTGMPDAEVLKRAKERADRARASEDDER